ncbi:MAG TPA: hypothetical protein VFQ65_10655 [Kofleriaceae bacterium]|nr:hypothetical protein [Kofleriaceae bacterium]
MLSGPRSRLAAIALVLAATFAWGVALPRGLFSGDEGIKLAQIQGLDHAGYRDGALLYRGQDDDPSNALHPLKSPGFTYEVDGRVYGTYTLLYPALAVPIYRAGGFAWVWLLSLAGLALMLIATAQIAVRVTASERVATFAVLAVGFATAVGLYACTIFEHTLAGGCLLSALAIVVGPVSSRRAFAAGAVFAAAICLRTELLAFGPSFAFVCAWRFGVRRQTLRSFALVAVGAAIVLALFVVFNLALSGVWHPTLVASKDAAKGSFADRACHLVAATLGGWGYAAVWATLALAVVATVLRRRTRVVTAIGLAVGALWIAMTLRAIATMGVRPVVGLLTTAPVIVLALVWRPAQARAGITSTVLAVAAALFVAIVVVLPKRGAIGGLELGPRYLIPVVPLFVIAALDAARASRIRIACATLLALAGTVVLVANARSQYAIRQLGANIVEVADQAGADVVTSDVWWVAQLAIPAQADRIVVMTNNTRDAWQRLYDGDRRRVLVLRGTPPDPGPTLVLRPLDCPCLDDRRLDPSLFELEPRDGRIGKR